MLRIVLCLSLLFVPAAALPACGGGGDGGGPAVLTRQYVGTQEPGDLWSWSILTDGSWTARNDTLGFDYSGTWAPLASGFLELAIAATTDPGTTPGDRAYALEVPDSVLVVKPAGSTDNVIIAARLGTCPASGSRTLNWVELTDSTWDETTDTAYGIADVTIAGAGWNVVNDRYLLDGSADGTDTIPGLTCSGGLITDPGAPGEVIVLAPTGLFITDSGPGAGGVMGMDAPAANIDLADLVAPGREYRAIQYADGSVGADDSRPNWARPDGLGGLTGGDYVDVAANIEDATTAATLVFTTQPMPGVVNGTLTDSAGTSDIVFMVNRLVGRYFLFGVSVNTATGQPYNFIAIEMP